MLMTTPMALLSLSLIGCTAAASAPDAAGPDTTALDSGTPDADNTSDVDGDGVPDVTDRCPGLDDRIDLNANALADCVENLLANGQFAADVTHWSPTPPSPRATIAFSTADGTGFARSGSARVVNIVAETSANAGGVASECIHTIPSTAYRLYTRYLKPAGQPGGDTAATVSFVAYTYQDTNCTVPLGAVSPPGSGNVTGTWAVHSDRIPATSLANVGSMRVSLSILKGATALPVAVTFDDLLMVAD